MYVNNSPETYTFYTTVYKFCSHVSIIKQENQQKNKMKEYIVCIQEGIILQFSLPT